MEADPDDTRAAPHHPGALHPDHPGPAALHRRRTAPEHRLTMTDSMNRIALALYTIATLALLLHTIGAPHIDGG
ncbi:hypothetical protein Adu01nite_25430 [Paractinoplanes durhamensis]|uniref:Uncharacterized protein n=1 Tax=Paractinoplanes durhamensis TaxID=113563 RepID=A0ABQ3YUG3_9ACTN|nr:hypothetical protein Adu01nite_25430 [Actinoplanes durhamensis]